MSSWRFEEDFRALYDELDPDDRALARTRPSRSPRGRGWGRALAAALVVALVLGLALFGVRASRPLNLALVAPEWRERALGQEIALRFRGRGLAQGAPEALTITWEEGTISLDVTPDRGLHLRVQTPEAEVTVVGTRFDVTRDGLGTEVIVQEGRVSALCSDGTARFLTAGGRLRCPRSAAAALGCARALILQGAAAEERLEMVQRGLSRPDVEEAVRDELVLLQVQTLDELGRVREALERAELALASGSPPRWKALTSIAARLRVSSGDCPGALLHLERLAAEEDPVALVLLADCVQELDPERARGALRRVLDLPLPEDRRASVSRRLEALGGDAERPPVR